MREFGVRMNVLGIWWGGEWNNRSWFKIYFNKCQVFDNSKLVFLSEAMLFDVCFFCEIFYVLFFINFVVYGISYVLRLRL